MTETASRRLASLLTIVVFAFSGCDMRDETIMPVPRGEETNKNELTTVNFENGRPVLEKGTLFIPKFTLQSAETTGGIMFAAKTQETEAPCLLTAMHLLGPSTGMDQQLSVEDISEKWSGVTGLELVTNEQQEFSGVGLGLPGASAEFAPSQTGDVMVFLALQGDQEKLNPVSISKTMPEAGDDLWLLSPNIANESLVHKATTLYVVHDTFLVYEFEEPIVIAGTSGAPIINEQGLVVAVHRGGGVEGTRTFGAGTLASKFLPSLNREIKNNQE